ncbi:hypothetical protein [Bradyrhizobium sp. LTSPM299]|nr:hypothetical protein [Bradyrhizobium sp. LTSPM299]
MTVMEERPTMEAILRKLRETQAKEPKRVPDHKPRPIPEEVLRIISE